MCCRRWERSEPDSRAREVEIKHTVCVVREGLYLAGPHVTKHADNYNRLNIHVNRARDVKCITL